MKKTKWQSEKTRIFLLFIVSLLDADVIRHPEWFKSSIQSLDWFKPTTQKPEWFKSTIQGLDWFKSTNQKPEWFKSCNQSFVWFNLNQAEKPILFRKAWIWLLYIERGLKLFSFLSV